MPGPDMSDHWIRLRGGWEWRSAGTDADHPQRLTLPHRWPAAVDGRIVLSRSFQAPTLNPFSEQLLLHLDDVAGLRAVRLNDRLIASPAAETSSLVVPLGVLASRRNLLTLETDLAAGRVPRPEDQPWGSVALVIRNVAAGTGPTDSLGGRGGLA